MASVSTSMGMFNTQLPLLNGKNYDYWAIVMRALFTSQDLWQFVEDGFEEPADKNEFNSLTQAEKDQLKSDKKEDAKGLFFLFQSVHESMFPRIAAATTSKEAWETLKTAYQGMEKVKTVKPQFIEEEAYDESLEKTVNDKNCLSRDEDDEEMAEMHPQTAAPTQGQQVAPLRRIECASPSTPQEATNEGTNSLFALSSHVDDSVHFKNAVEDRKWTKPMNGRKELKFLEDLFKEYGVRYVTLAKMAEMGFTANTLVNMTEEEIEDLMKTLVELYQMDFPIGKRFEITSSMRAEKEQVVDILTKPLDQKSFEFLMKCLGMTNNPAVEIKGECWKLIPTANNEQLDRNLISRKCSSLFDAAKSLLIFCTLMCIKFIESDLQQLSGSRKNLLIFLHFKSALNVQK